MPEACPLAQHPEDAAAVAEFVRRLAWKRGMLEGLLRRLLPTPEDVGDVLLETLLDAYLGRQALRLPTQLGPWLRTIAYNRAMQWQRRRRR